MTEIADELGNSQNNMLIAAMIRNFMIVEAALGDKE